MLVKHGLVLRGATSRVTERGRAPARLPGAPLLRETKRAFSTMLPGGMRCNMQECGAHRAHNRGVSRVTR